MADLSGAEWALAGAAAVGVGISKAGFPGMALLHVMIFAFLFGARDSTGVVLPMLIAGDLGAIRAFYPHTRWDQLARTLPAACVGVVAGAWLMAHVSDAAFGPILGWIILILTLWMAMTRGAEPLDEGSEPFSTETHNLGSEPFSTATRQRGTERASVERGGSARTVVRSVPGTLVSVEKGSDPGTLVSVEKGSDPSWRVSVEKGSVPLGLLAGTTTMLANAGGPVMTLYLLAMRLPKLQLTATAAWFFFAINVFKVPFSVGLGLITPHTLTLNAVLLPGIVLGLVIGRWLIHRVPQRLFNQLLLAFAGLASLRLIGVL